MSHSPHPPERTDERAALRMVGVFAAGLAVLGAALILLAVPFL